MPEHPGANPLPYFTIITIEVAKPLTKLQSRSTKTEWLGASSRVVGAGAWRLDDTDV